MVANQPKVKGGVLFVDSSDKAARFIWTCNAFNVPLLFLADVPGFMIGSKVEREGIIRSGRQDDLGGLGGDRAQDLGGRAQVLRRRPVRDGGPGLRAGLLHRPPDRPDRRDGAEAAINAVFYNQIQKIEDAGERARFVEAKRAEYAADIDILHLASELVVDAMIDPADLRPELVARFALYGSKERDSPSGEIRSRRSDPHATALKDRSQTPASGQAEIACPWGIKDFARCAEIRTHPA